MAAKASKQFQCPTHWTLAQRLDHYTDKSDGPDVCWPWTGVLSVGYGQVWRKGRMRWAHRLAWELANGPMSAGMCVCHHCDNRPCCNPAHLFCDTHQGNMTDRNAKGRQMHGSTHVNAKLTETAVRMIRTATGSQRTVAMRFNVHHATVGRILRGEMWKHVV